MKICDSQFHARPARLFREPRCHWNGGGGVGWGGGERYSQITADANTAALNEASTVATDNAVALQTLVGADQANNIATGALAGGAVTGPGVATLGGDPVPTTTATPWTTYALYVALAFGGWYFWKKHRKQK